MMTSKTVLSELKAIIHHALIWHTLGKQDIKLRYRRSTIGPFWITLSMAVTIYTMGFLYSHLFKVELAHYFPYLAAGIIGWSFISMLITESSNAFIESESYIRNQESYFSLFMMRLIIKNMIIFAHNILAIIPILFIYKTIISFKLLLLLPGLLLICVNTVFWGTLLAVIGTRYRDFGQIINSIVQVVFFLTPIVWMPSLLPERIRWITLYNPFNQFLNLIRDPLINHNISIHTLLMVSTMTLLGFIMYTLTMHRYKYKIVFWL